MTFRSLCVFALAGALALPASARPVSYAGGWTVMQDNNGDYSSLHVPFSPTQNYSIGVYAEQNWELDTAFTGLQYTRLVKRWNAPASQGNLYFHLGAGVADPFGSDGAEAAGFAGVTADWETRRWFTSYDARLREFGSADSITQTARLGIAPYVAEFGALHTWVMLEVQNDTASTHDLTITPLLRFFKGEVLVETGYRLQDDSYMLNLMYIF